MKPRPLDWSVVVIPPADIDRLGLHVCNVSGMRRALAGLRGAPGYVLTDGFPVRGLAVPALAMWKGDQVAGLRGGGLHHRQGDQGPDHVRPARGLPGIRIFPA